MAKGFQFKSNGEQALKNHLEWILAKPENEKLQSDKVLDFLLKIKERKDEMFNRLTITTITLSLILLLDLMAPNGKVSVFGITMDNTPGLREAVVFSMATLNILFAALAYELRALSTTIRSMFDRVYGPDSTAFGRFVTQIPFLPDLAYNFQGNPTLVKMRPSRLARAGFILFILCSTAVLCAFFGANFYLTIQAILKIIAAPGLPGYWPWAVIGVYVASCIVAAFGTAVASVPRNYADNVVLFEVIERVAPSLADQLAPHIGMKRKTK